MATHTAPKTIQVTALTLTSGHTLVGEAGGLCLVYDTRPHSLLPGFVTVETEHGSLILDDDPAQTYPVLLDAAPPAQQAP